MTTWTDVAQLAEESLSGRRLLSYREFWQDHRSDNTMVPHGSAVVLAGRVLEVLYEMIKIKPLRFEPWKGFVPQDSSSLQVVIPDLRKRSIRLNIDGEIMLFGKLEQSESPLVLTFTRDVLVMHRPKHVVDMPFNMLHLFSGSYCGWSRASEWLSSHVSQLSSGSQTFIDADPMVLGIWSQQHNQEFYRGKTDVCARWDPSVMVGICTAVDDPTILLRCLWPTNAVTTASPPCVSWSRGGKHQGLDCAAGFAAFETVQLVELQQPLLLFMECADEIIVHPHFKLLQAALKILGYALLWQQVVPLHQLTHNSRTRWLAIWKRSDVSCQAFDTTIIPRAPPLTPWHSPLNCFWLPEDLKQLLVLTPEALRCYANPQFLPAAKRARLATGSSQEVLQRRVPSPTDALPTLCCAYSKQHELEAAHLADKGIFASIVQVGDVFAFLSPLTFVSLFGSTHKVVLPCNVQQAFHVLGNAIAQPHAMLALAIGLVSLSNAPVSVLSLVQESWHDRLTADNAIVHRSGQWITVQKADAFFRQLDFRFLVLPNPEIRYMSVRTTLVQRDGTRDTSIACNASLLEAIQQILVLEECDQSAFRFSTPAGHDIVPQSSEAALAAFPVVQCYWKDICFASLAVGGQLFVETCPPPDELPPTVPFSVREEEEPCEIECKSWSFDDLRRHPSFRDVLSLVEHLFRAIKGSGEPKCVAAFAWEAPPVLFAVELEQHDPLGCAQSQIDALFPGKFQVYLAPGKLKKIADGPLVLVRPADHPDDALVVFVEIAPTTCVFLKAISRCIDFSTVVTTSHGKHRIVTHNFRSAASSMLCYTGDIFVIEKQAIVPVIAAGHHLDQPAAILPAGASFQERVAFSVATQGWAASDELHNALRILQILAPDFLQAFGFQQWDTSLNEFDEGAFDEFTFATQGRTCLLLQVASHWALVAVVRDPRGTKLTITGLPQQLAQRAAFITCRLIDIAPHRAILDFDFIRPPEHMCGWTIVFQLFTQAGVLDHLPDASYFWNILTTEERRLINDMLIASQHQWTLARADPVLRGFAFQMRLDFFCQLALKGRDDDPVTDLPLDPVFPRGNPDTGATPSALPGRPLSIRLPPVDASTQTEATQVILQRLQACSGNPGWLFSDTLDYHCELLRLLIPNTLFAAPALWDQNARQIDFFNGFICHTASYERIILPIIWEQHWVLCEFHRDSWDYHVVVRGPHALRQHSGHIAADAAFGLLRTECAIHVSFVCVTPPQHLCGWALLFDLYRRFGTLLPQPSPSLLQDLRSSELSPWYVWVHDAAIRQWGANVDPSLRAFASAGLLLHLGRIDQQRIPAIYQAAGAVGTPSQAAGSIDPLTVHDPWAKKAPPSRWEDLHLGKAHPFFDEKNVQLEQLHRLQATGHNGGIVLTTKQHLPELIKLGTKQTFVALLPQLDDSSKAVLGVAAHGPFEVILYDKSAGQTYKRVTHAVAIQGKFSFTLKDPAAEFCTSEIAELVLEFDTRLVQKSDFDQAAANPVSFFRGHVVQHCPAVKDHLTLYGFRHNRHPSATKNDDQLQIIAKIPKSARQELLQLSGTDAVLVRDYVDKGATPVDVTVVPKFWPITAKALRELLISTNSVTGCAGVTMTRRGLAIRAWAKGVAEVRKQLLPADPRLTASNLHVVPRVMLDSSGWPAGASPADIVEAVNKAVGLPPVPTRTFRNAGVHVWQLGFESPPKVDDFTVKINGEIFQILLAPVIIAEKGSGKGKHQRKAPKAKKTDASSASPGEHSIPAPNPESKRLEVLEARFDTLQGQVTGIEKKQVSMESKLDSRFEEIGNTLRQLVQMSSASRSHDKTGETPPSKYSKTA